MPLTVENRPIHEWNDVELLEGFRRDGDEACFREIVQRFGTVVMGVCQRALGDRHDAEDAFQLTFLTLAQNAKRVRNPAALGSWLYGVACRKARKVSALRGQARRSTDMNEPHSRQDDPFIKLAERFEQRLLDEELGKLPEKYRSPLVLHYVVGLRCVDVARRLGVTLTALEGRLRRGRERLRQRLIRRGVSMGALAAISTETAQAAVVSEKLVANTVHVCCTQSRILPHEPIQEPGSILSGGTTPMSLKTIVVSTSIMMGVCGLLTVPGHGRGGEGGGRSILLAAQDVAAPATNTEAPGTQPPATEVSGAEVGYSGLAGGAGFGGDDSSPAAGSQKAAVEPEVFSYQRQSPMVQRIFGALDEETTMELIEVPLQEVLDFTSNLHAVPIVLDAKVIDQIDRDQPINLDVKGLPLKSALQLVLEPLELEFVVKHDVLLITTNERAESMVETRVYNVRGIEAPGEPDTLANVITRTVSPDSWDSMGGPGAVEGLPGCLVVTTDQRTHSMVVDLLHQLHRHAATTRPNVGVGYGMGAPGMGFPSPGINSDRGVSGGFGPAPGLEAGSGLGGSGFGAPPGSDAEGGSESSPSGLGGSGVPGSGGRGSGSSGLGLGSPGLGLGTGGGTESAPPKRSRRR